MSNKEPNVATNAAPSFEERKHLYEAILQETGEVIWVPKMIGQFEVRGVVGRGAFGLVYRGFDPRIGREVAIKVPQIAGVEQKELFLREAHAIADIHHSNICPVYQLGEYQINLAGVESQQPFIVFRLILGGTLEDIIKKQSPLPVRTVVQVIRKLALGLDAAHAKGVIHRDLKPANVLYDSEADEFLITDFGLAVLAEEALSSRNAGAGTFLYMAPEQATGEAKSIGPATDVYALGVIFYLMLTGVMPLTGNSHELMYKKLFVDPVAPSKMVPGIDSAIDEVCLKALARSSGDRFQSARELVLALLSWLSNDNSQSNSSKHRSEYHTQGEQTQPGNDMPDPQEPIVNSKSEPNVETRAQICCANCATRFSAEQYGLLCPNCGRIHARHFLFMSIAVLLLMIVPPILCYSLIDDRKLAKEASAISLLFPLIFVFGLARTLYRTFASRDKT